MAKIKIYTETDKVFGSLVCMTNGIIELKVTVDFGPRAIHFSRVGMENMFYQDAAKGSLGDKFEIYEGDIHRLYGGHRLWISPEEMPRCYHPDNNPVAWKEIDGGLEFTAPVEKHTQLQKIMRFEMDEATPYVKVDHTIVNMGVWDVEFAIWSLTMLDKGGKAVMPQNERDTGLLPNRNFTFWPYCRMNDKRVYFGDKFITLTQDDKAVFPFKLGYNNESGWACYFNKKQAFVKFFEPQIDAPYPDGGCTYESFTNDVMVESESLSELALVGPNEALTHTEEWELYEASDVPSNDEAEIAKILEKFM